MKVADVMTRDVVAVSAQTPLREVARILSDSRISGVPVVDAAGDDSHLTPPSAAD